MSTTVLTTDPPSPTLEGLLAWLRQHRAAGSVHYDAQQQLWQVFGYADVLRVLTDSAAFSSDFSALLPSQPDFAHSHEILTPRRRTPPLKPCPRLPQCLPACSAITAWDGY
jgi:cytochrome P450